MTVSVLQKAKPFAFLREVRAELEKVTWPTRQQTIRLTTIVVGVSVAIGAILGAFDYLFTTAITYLINR